MTGSTPQAARRREGQGDYVVMKNDCASEPLRGENGESEAAARSKVPYAVLTVHTRVTPSFPGWVAGIFPSGHMPRGVKSCSNHTISLTLRGGVALFHFCRRSKVGKYFFKNRFQKWFETFWISFQELKDSE